jgi:hypothetical protein
MSRQGIKIKMIIFNLTKEEVEKINAWRKDHDCKLDDDPIFPGQKKIGAIGGQFTYLFTPTGLGTITIVRCGCGAEIDLTDVDSW